MTVVHVVDEDADAAVLDVVADARCRRRRGTARSRPCAGRRSARCVGAAVRRPASPPFRETPCDAWSSNALVSQSGLEHEDAVTDARRILAARRLKRDAPAVAADDRIRRLEAAVLTPVRHAGEVLAVRLELQLPDVDVVRVLFELVAARFDQRVLAVGKDALDLVVLARPPSDRPSSCRCSSRCRTRRRTASGNRCRSARCRCCGSPAPRACTPAPSRE